MRQVKRMMFLLALTAFFISGNGRANGAENGVASTGGPTLTSLCEISAAPDKFQGKLVEIRAIVQSGFQTSLLRDDSCSAFIWLSGIDTAHPGGAPAAFRKDRNYQKMLEYLEKKAKSRDGVACARCAFYKVTATVAGRFEHVRKDGADSNSRPAGFGYMKSYESQLVLEGVSNVVAEPIDRSGEKNK